MSRKNILIAVIALIIVGGIAFWAINNKGQLITGNIQNESLTPEQIIKKSVDTTAQAITARDSDTCGKIEEEASRNYCFNAVLTSEATDKRDASFCEEINDENMKFVCKNSVIYFTAQDKKDTKLCDTMTDKARIANCKELINVAPSVSSPSAPVLPTTTSTKK